MELEQLPPQYFSLTRATALSGDTDFDEYLEG